MYLFNVGENNWNWRGGKSPDRQEIYSSNEWKKLIVAVYARDNATCRLCGSRKDNKIKMHIHHIFSFTHFPELRMDCENLVLLCKKCHNFVHSLKNVEKKFIGNGDK